MTNSGWPSTVRVMGLVRGFELLEELGGVVAEGG